MSKVEEIWNARDANAQAFFIADVIGPLVVAIRPHDMKTSKQIADAAPAWILTLKDVPADVLRDGVEALLLEGPMWMPRPGDLRRVCAAAITARRREISARANAVTESCGRCQGSTWAPMIDAAGVARVTRCDCHKVARALYDGLPEPLALPPAKDDEAVA